MAASRGSPVGDGARDDRGGLGCTATRCSTRSDGAQPRARQRRRGAAPRRGPVAQGQVAAVDGTAWCCTRRLEHAVIRMGSVRGAMFAAPTAPITAGAQPSRGASSRLSASRRTAACDPLVGRGERDPHVPLAGRGRRTRPGATRMPRSASQADGVPAVLVAGRPEVERRLGVVDPEAGRLAAPRAASRAGAA